MRVAFVAGFFAPVEEKLLKEFARQLKLGSVIWIPQKGVLQPPDFPVFNSRFFDSLSKGAVDILILLAILRGKEWVEGKINESIAQANLRFQGKNIAVQTTRNAQDHAFVLQEIKKFSPSLERPLTLDLIRQRVGAKKIICFRGSENTGFRTVLERDGFPDGAFEEFFEERVLEYDTHPDKVEHVIRYAATVLYAFHGLKHMTGTSLDTYSGRLFKQALSRDCVAQLKDWLVK